MSYILSGLVVPDSIDNARRIRDNLGIPMDVFSLNAESSIFVNRTRDDFGSHHQAVDDLLCHYERVLVVIWDDQHGIRISRIYHQSGKRDSFGQDDELYVELDDEGRPLLAGKVYTFREVEDCRDDREFETCKNAIELGCEASGFCPPSLLMGFIRTQG